MEQKKGAKGGSGKPPRIMKHVKSLVINDGDPVTLTCTIKCKYNLFLFTTSLYVKMCHVF